MATRIFLIGVIILFFGLQLRAIDTFVLNEKVTRVINKRVAKPAPTSDADVYAASLYGPLSDTESNSEITSLPLRRQITPPRWLGYSILSIGAVAVVTSPLFRK